MNIADMLKNRRGVVVSFGSRHLSWDNIKKVWKVWGKDCGFQLPWTMIVTEDESEAVKYLLFEERTDDLADKS